MHEVWSLTSDVFEVDGLPVRVEELDDRVVIVLHSAADGGHFSLNHRHIVSGEVLTLHLKINKLRRGENETS